MISIYSLVVTFHLLDGFYLLFQFNLEPTWEHLFIIVSKDNLYNFIIQLELIFLIEFVSLVEFFGNMN